jgi:hypothetical protein
MNTSKWIARPDTRPVGVTAGGMEFAERSSDLEKRLSVAVTAASGRLGNTLISPLRDLNLPELEDDSRDHGTSLYD